MTRNTTGPWVLPLIILSGCVDLGLLDELIPFDAGAGDQGGPSDGDADADGDGDSDADGDGPPATDADDVTAPALAPLSCAFQEEDRGGFCVAAGNGTAAIRFATDEPATVVLSGPAGVRVEVVSEPWAAEHLAVVAGAPADAEVELEASIADVNGNSGAHPLSIVALGGPAVAITEVLADPFGPEPAQEIVEIANFGAAEVDLASWMIDDNGDANGDLLPEGCALGPGQVAILVAADYDPACTEDPEPAEGALIVPVDGSIATGGLKNDEAETVELYDDSGAVVSAYDARLGDPVEGRSAARVRAEAPDGCPLAFGDAPVAPPTPGAAPFVP
jgi:hypothetical protein